MKFLNYLQEKYLALAKQRDYVYEIFVNPDSKELKEIDKGEGLRFIADKKTKSLYISDISFIHPYFLQYLLDNGTIKADETDWVNLTYSPRFLMGQGETVKGKIKIRAESRDFHTPPNALKSFAWAKAYFTNFEEFYKKKD